MKKNKVNLTEGYDKVKELFNKGIPMEYKHKCGNWYPLGKIKGMNMNHIICYLYYTQRLRLMDK